MLSHSFALPPRQGAGALVAWAFSVSSVSRPLIRQQSDPHPSAKSEQREDRGVGKQESGQLSLWSGIPASWSVGRLTKTVKWPWGAIVPRLEVKAFDVSR